VNKRAFEGVPIPEGKFIHASFPVVLVVIASDAEVAGYNVSTYI
jgi:hypothetical protein